MRKAILVFVSLFCGLACFAQEQINLAVYFRFDKYDLDSIYKSKIDSVIQKHSISKIDIKAHCDSFGSNQYNDALSLKRANGVKQYLISKKINNSIIDVKGFGKRVPLNQNENARARALNRRAEIAFEVSDSVKTNKPDTLIKTTEARSSPVRISDTQLSDTSTLSLKDIEVGKSFVLENLNFYGGRHVLLPKSQKTLRLLLNTLKANPNLEIEIQGYICCERTGDGIDMDTGTLNLSWSRARAIYDYLVKRGIDPARLSYKGFGSSHKLVLEFTEADRTTNRRVEIKVLKK